MVMGEKKEWRRKRKDICQIETPSQDDMWMWHYTSTHNRISCNYEMNTCIIGKYWNAADAIRRNDPGRLKIKNMSARNYLKSNGIKCFAKRCTTSMDAIIENRKLDHDKNDAFQANALNIASSRTVFHHSCNIISESFSDDFMITCISFIINSSGDSIFF